MRRRAALRGSPCAGRALRRAGGRRLRDRRSASRSPRARSPKPRRSPTSGSTGWGPASPVSRSTAADGQKGYISGVGDSVYYGDCVQRKGIFGGGSCLLPLQVTTVIYGLHSNATLGPQRNMVIRGVPATVYDEGRSIELYSGRVAIDIFSDTFAHAHRAALGTASAQRPRLGDREAAAARLLPRPVRAGERRTEPRDGEPAGTRLPAGRPRRKPRPSACPAQPEPE